MYYELRNQNQPLVNPLVQSETETWRDESCPIRAWLNDNIVPDPNGVVFYDEIASGIAEETGEWVSYKSLGRTLKRINRIHGQPIALRRINTTDEHGNLVKKRAIVGFRRRTPNDTPPPDKKGTEPTSVVGETNEALDRFCASGPFFSNISADLKNSEKCCRKTVQSGKNGPEAVESPGLSASSSIQRSSHGDDGDAALFDDGGCDRTERLRRWLLDYGERRGYPRIVVWLRVFEGELSWRSDLVHADHARLVVWGDTLALNDEAFASVWRARRAEFV